jgi:hypothetical protein
VVAKDVFACATRAINPMTKRQKHHIVKASEAAPADLRESRLIRSPSRTAYIYTYIFDNVEL